MRLTCTALAALMAFTAPVLALDPGTPSDVSPSIVIYDFDENQVYSVVGSFGFTTQIQMAPDEIVERVDAGDSEAWDISVSADQSYVSVKPLVKPPRASNLVINTDRRRYNIALTANEETDPQNVTFTARFDYPDDIDTAAALNRAIDELEGTQADLQEERSARINAQQALETALLEQSESERAARAEAERRRLDEQIADLRAALDEEGQGRTLAEQERAALQRRLDTALAEREAQLQALLQTRLAESESSRQIAETERRQAEQALAALRAQNAAAERERLADDLAEARGLIAENDVLRARLDAIAEREAAERRAARRAVVFDAFADAGSLDAGGASVAGAGGTSSEGGSGYRDRLIAAREADRVYLDDAAARGIQGVEAVQIDRLDAKVLQGTLLAGTLETAISSELSGLVRGVLSRPAWSADGTRILADRGSRLVGEYRSFVRFGTSRVLIAWTRLITTDGISVELGSPGTDRLGRAGMTGFVDTQFSTRFGAAALVSLIGAGSAVLVQLAADEASDNTIRQDTVEDVADNASDAAAQLLDPYIDIPTIVYVDQGTPFNVFVARDLDFSNVR